MKSKDVLLVHLVPPCEDPSSIAVHHDAGAMDPTRGPSSGAAQRGIGTPSLEYEAVICAQLRRLIENSQASFRHSMSLWYIILRSALFKQEKAIWVACAMLIISCGLHSFARVVICTCLFIVVYAIYVLLQGYLFWMRLTEVKYRTTNVMAEVIHRWTSRIGSAKQPSQTAQERRLLSIECFAHLNLKAFRMVAIVDSRTQRLKHIQKCLMVKGARRLDEATLRARRYVEPVGICKLVDVMRVALENNAIVLKSLADKCKPPRLPNLFISASEFIEDESTTDESDGENDSRTPAFDGSGRVSTSASRQMEYFIHRVMLLFWIAGMLATVGAGFFRYSIGKTTLYEGIFLYPPIALLGLLPVNAIMLNRFLVLYANIFLDKLFHLLVSKRTHSLDDRLPRFSFWSTLYMALRVFFRVEPKCGGRNPLVFSISLVDTLAMASVIAILDQEGIVTDMVPLPVEVLMLKPPPEAASSSSDSEDNIMDCLTGCEEVKVRERRRNMKKQVKRNKFQAKRLATLRFTQSAKEDLAVEFADGKDSQKYQMHVRPICLGILVHALAKPSMSLETWTEPFRFVDRSLRWSRAMHWIPRAYGFSDSVADGFLVIARIFTIATSGSAGYHDRTPEQACSLLLEDGDRILHVFTLGTPHLVTKHCTTYWTGTTVEAFHEEEKAEVLHTGKHHWEDRMCYETVALAHRVLPERYRSFVNTLPRDPRRYHEYFFCDGEEVNCDSWKKAQAERAASHPKGGGKGSEKEAGPTKGHNHPSKVLYDIMEGSCGHRDDDIRPARRGNGQGARHYRSGSFSALTLPLRYSAPRLMPQRSLSFGDQPSKKAGALEEDDCLTTKTFIRLMATNSHTFLGLVALRDSVRPNVQTSMAMLDEAGVRCMYFVVGNKCRAHSFGSRVGLETDWNCCISLKSDAVALDPYSIRAQLPFGIKSIRKHILHVDPIPLQVNLFSHAHGVATRAMLSILQDNHEVVIAVGSVFNHSNIRSFTQADLAVGVLPTRRGVNADKEHVLKHSRIVEPSDFSATNALNRDLPLYRNIAELFGCACTLRSPPTTSVLSILVTLVRQARIQLSGINNCVEFILHTNLFVVMVNTLTLLVGGFLLLDPIVVIVELNLILPILALALTHTAHSSVDIMKIMPSRANYFIRLAICRHGVVVWGLRYFPSVLGIFTLGFTAAQGLCGADVQGLSQRTSEDCMHAARGYVCWTLNYWIILHGWTHLSRYHPITLGLPHQLCHGRPSARHQLARFLKASALVVGLTMGLVLVNTPRSALGAAFVPSTLHTIASLFFPVVFLALDLPIKRWRARRFSLMQKFRKLSFGTRLGMHSPRGDYEPEGMIHGGVAASHHTGNEWAEGGGGDEAVRIPLRKRFTEAFYRYVTIQGGKLELNCVCCDHIGGNYASYLNPTNA
ncbi:unnamed protein product [Phytomonas sp. Hart1]|nr:unnamed protein product [Phytomonas sp. Hart1]|eukprot:CCW69683.1 unnamed protein product [Phytomonas sp. isolate Hart1]